MNAPIWKKHDPTKIINDSTWLLALEFHNEESDKWYWDIFKLNLVLDDDGKIGLYHHESGEEFTIWDWQDFDWAIRIDIESR